MKKFARALSALAAVCAFVLHGPAHAQESAASYPSKPIHFIVAFAPGGGTDLLARLVANQLTAILGQPVVVENKAGGGGIIATQQVANAAPDGYTVLVGGSAPMVFNQIIKAKLPYAPTDLTPVTILGTYPLVVAAKNDLPVRNVKEMIQYAKDKGGNMTYGHPGATFQVIMEYLNSRAGIKMTPIPYRGGGPGALALMGGEIDLLVADMASIEPMDKAGKARALFVTTLQRNPVLPNVPTVAESGVPGFNAIAFAALVVHSKTSPAIALKLQQATAKALAAPEVREQLLKLGIEPGGKSSHEAAAEIKHELETYTPIAESIGLKGTE